MELNEVIRTARKRKGLSQEELSNLLDVSRQAVQKWESGSSQPELTKLVQLSNVLDFSLDEALKNKTFEETNKIETKEEAEPINNVNEEDLYLRKSDYKVIKVFLIIGCILTPISEMASLLRITNYDNKSFLVLLSFLVTVPVTLFTLYKLKTSHCKKSLIFPGIISALFVSRIAGILIFVLSPSKFITKGEDAVVSADKSKEKMYQNAKTLLYSDFGTDLEASVKLFKELDDYKDSKALLEKAKYNLANKYLTMASYGSNLKKCHEVLDILDTCKETEEVESLKEKTQKEIKRVEEENIQIIRDSFAFYEVDNPSIVMLDNCLKDIIKVNKIIDKKDYAKPLAEEFDAYKNRFKNFFVRVYENALKGEKNPKVLVSLLDDVIGSQIFDDSNEIVSKINERKEVALALRVKRKKVIIAVIVAGIFVAIAASIAIALMVDENNKKAEEKYNLAVAALADKRYDEAISYFSSLNNYKDSSNKILLCNGLASLDNAIKNQSSPSLRSAIESIIVIVNEHARFCYQSFSVEGAYHQTVNYQEHFENIDSMGYSYYKPIVDGYSISWNAVSYICYADVNTTMIFMEAAPSLYNYSIYYYLDGGVNNENNQTSFTILSDNIPVYEPTYDDDHIFGGWYDNDKYEGEPITYIQSGTHQSKYLYAKWIDVNDFKYSFVTSDTVAITGIKNANINTLIIPSYIIASGTKYPVTEIERYAFAGCTQLTSIYVPDSVTSIGLGAFSGCASLKMISLPYASQATSSSFGLTHMFGSIFGNEKYKESYMVSYRYQGWYYTSYIPLTLTDVTIRLGTMEDIVFYGCTSIKNITIGKDVPASENALWELKNLSTISYLGTVSEWIAHGYTSAVIFKPGSGTVIHCLDGDYIY